VPVDPASPAVPAPTRVKRGAPTALADAIGAIQAVHGRTVLVGAGGADAERAVLAAVRAFPEGRVRVVRIGILGDVEAESRRALAEAGMACAVRVAPAKTGWDVRAVGDCAAPPPPPPPAPPPAPEAPPKPAGPDPAELERTWRQRALVRVNLGGRAAVPWTIRDGRGRTLTAQDVARAVGDTGLQAELRDAFHQSRAVAWGLAIAGGTLGLGGLTVAALGAGDAPTFEEPRRAGFADEITYQASVDEATARYEEALRTWEGRRADRYWAAGSLVVGALVTAAAAPVADRAGTARQREIAWHWTVPEADAKLAAYNESLRAQLGLPSLAPRPRARPLADLPDLPDAPEPVPDAPDVPEAPETPPASAPSAPDTAPASAPSAPDTAPASAPSAPDAAPAPSTPPAAPPTGGGTP
jgi:hypothetical protein